MFLVDGMNELTAIGERTDMLQLAGCDIKQNARVAQEVIRRSAQDTGKWRTIRGGDAIATAISRHAAAAV